MKFFDKKDLKLFKKQQEKDIKMSEENRKLKENPAAKSWDYNPWSEEDNNIKIKANLSEQEQILRNVIENKIQSQVKKDWDDYNEMRLNQSKQRTFTNHLSAENNAVSELYTQIELTTPTFEQPEQPRLVEENDQLVKVKEAVDEDADTLITVNIDTLTDYLVQQEINLGHHYGLVTQELKDSIFDKHYDYIYNVLALNTKKREDYLGIKTAPEFTGTVYTGAGGWGGFTGTIGTSGYLR